MATMAADTGMATVTTIVIAAMAEAIGAATGTGIEANTAAGTETAIAAISVAMTTDDSMEEITTGGRFIH